MTPEGWQTLGFETPRDLAPLPADEVAKITGTGQFKSGKAFDVKLYNGSSWDVYEVEYEISAEGAKVQGPGENPFMCIGKQWTRRFRERTKLESLSSAVDYFDVGGSVESCAASWRVIGAHGVVARR